MDEKEPMKHPDSLQLSGLLDGDLSALEREEVEAHLSRCDGCATLLQELASVKAMAEKLPDRAPARDLWPGISEAIRDAARDPDIIHLHPVDPPRPRRPARIPLPQAAAAGLILALFSGTLGAWLGQGTLPSVARGAEDAPWVSMVAAAAPGMEGAAREVARLESALNVQRERLDSITVQLLERNLAAIDRAIRESVEALQADPGNAFLLENIERAVSVRADYLQDATLILGPRT